MTAQTQEELLAAHLEQQAIDPDQPTVEEEAEASPKAFNKGESSSKQVLSSQSSSDLFLGRSVVVPIIEEEMLEEEESPLITRRKRSGTSHSVPDLTAMSQDEADQGMGPDLPDFEPVAAVKRPKLILPSDEEEDDQATPQAQVVAQETAAVVTPAETVEVGTKTTSPEVDKTMAAPEAPQAKAMENLTSAEPIVSPSASQVSYTIMPHGEGSSIADTSNLSGSTQEAATVMSSAAGRAFLQRFKSADEACEPIKAELDQLLIKLETPGFPVLQNLEMLLRMKTLLQKTSELKPFLASSGQFLMKWLDRIVGNALKIRELPNEKVGPAELVRKYRAQRATRMALLYEAEASIKELEEIEEQEQMLCAQIEADEYDRAQLLLELQEVKAQIKVGEATIDALTSQAIVAMVAESKARSLQKSLDVEIDNVKDLVSSTLAFIK